ncbi:DUF3073 domain-containing protein [Pengzhenrongella frigida]|uniref:DUF3073 domain-containing protein n=1 Tax=Pengzhenrongella frigida TaxID=1259133 RepID=A0A4Q5N072_9MICO|nr:DUF3073 domain-containing protein [Cellulomonas sp. HLT2-17]RYV51448.1 DUF3073 domain-containing protein [Cellulomonas sp. HLT2-17]
MGRGRQKAKQTKVARDLKYYSPDTNYRALEQELTSPGQTDLATGIRRPPADSNDEVDPDTYTRWATDDR